MTMSFLQESATLFGGKLPTRVRLELTQGFLPGQTYIWEVSFQYRINSFMQANADYSGRSEAGGTPIHTMTAEVRAFF